jgi:hypothetical protein
VPPDSPLTGGLSLAMFDAQFGNGHLDLATRYLGARPAIQTGFAPG